MQDQLKPALFNLKRLGFKNLNALAYQDAILSVSSLGQMVVPSIKVQELIQKDKKISLLCQ